MMKPTKEEIKKAKELKLKQMNNKELIKKQRWRRMALKNLVLRKNFTILL